MEELFPSVEHVIGVLCTPFSYSCTFCERERNINWGKNFFSFILKQALMHLIISELSHEMLFYDAVSNKHDN